MRTDNVSRDVSTLPRSSNAAVVSSPRAEVFVAGEQESVLTSEVVVRWRPEVASPMRFRIGARALLIRAAFDPDGRRRFLVCACEEFSA